MIWTNKTWLFGLWLLPIAVFLLRRAAVKSREQMTAFAEPEMVRRLAPGRSGLRELVRGSLIVAGLALLLIAAAGPRSAGELVQVEKKGADMMILLDISRSMLADDTKPNRLESAKLDILDLLERGEGDRFGLVLFAGKPMVKIPLTSDTGFFQEVLKSVSVSDAPRGGTEIGGAIRMALRGETDPARDRAILLITDGEDHESDAIRAAGQAAELGVKIFTVAMGDAEIGGKIPLYDQQGKLTGYQKYNGEEIRTKTDRELLRQIAEKTGGAFLDMGKTPTNLGSFYSKSVNLRRSGYAERQRRVWKEEYQPFLLAGLLFVCGGYFVSPYRAAVPLALAVCLALFSPAHVGLAQEGDGSFADPPVPSSAEEAAPDAGPVPPSGDSADIPGGGDSAPAAPDTNLNARDLYNRACRLIAEGDEDAALAHLEEALKKTETMKHAEKLRGKILYNMGVLRAHALQRQSDRLKAETSETETETNSSLPGSPPMPFGASSHGGGESAPKPDLLDEYRKGAARRTAEQEKTAEETEQVFDLFRRAGDEGEKTVAGNASRARDLLYSWAQGENRAFLAREREIREKTFEPAGQIRWLLEELTGLREQKTLNSPPGQPRDWQRLYALGIEAKERAADLDSLLEQGRFRDDEEPEKSAVRLDDLENACAALREASAKIPAEPESAAKILRGALEAIDRAGLTYKEYPDVVMDALARQEEIVKQADSLVSPEQEKEKSAEDTQDGRRIVSRETILDRNAAVMRRVARMMADAGQEFQQRPLTVEETAEGAGQNEKELSSDEEFFAEPDPASEDAPPEAEELSPEEKIRLSMKRALEWGPEIEEENQTLSLLSPDRFSAEAPRSETRILELLRRIAEPLQEKQDQNQQDQQNQNQQNQNQQNQNSQDQNPQDRNQQDSSSQNQGGQGEENQDSQNPPQNPNDPDDSQSSPENETPQSEEQPNQDESAAGTPEEEEARRNEEKAESMMRKVDQRQQNAEEFRRAREALFHRYEKPEKDW